MDRCTDDSDDSDVCLLWLCQDGTCSCNLPGCIHVMAVRIAAGLNVSHTRKRTNLTALRRKYRAGRKQGRKRGLDSVELRAPDSVRPCGRRYN